MTSKKSDSDQTQAPPESDPANSLLSALEAAKKKRDSQNQNPHHSPHFSSESIRAPHSRIKVRLVILGVLSLCGFVWLWAKIGEKLTQTPSPLPQKSPQIDQTPQAPPLPVGGIANPIRPIRTTPTVPASLPVPAPVTHSDSDNSSDSNPDATPTETESYLDHLDERYKEPSEVQIQPDEPSNNDH